MKKANAHTFRIAAFDFGSNAIKCLIANWDGKELLFLNEYRYQNRLGSYLDSCGLICTGGIEDTIIGAKKLLQYCSEQGVSKYLAVGTEALRKAANASEIVLRLQQETGLELRIISPHEEALLAWQGAITELDAPAGKVLVVDSGGASTELICGTAEGIMDVLSIPQGAVNLAKACIKTDPLSDRDFTLLHSTIDDAFCEPACLPKVIIGVGGGFTACAKVAIGKNDYESLQHSLFYLSGSELNRQIQMLRSHSLIERKQIPGMEPERADILIASAMIASKILSVCNSSGMHISVRGLRYGLLRSWQQAIS